MWSEHSWMGQVEIYGDMIKECFGITFPEEFKSKEQICEVCITRLRNSLRFRRQVALCHAQLLEQINTMLTTDLLKPIKIEFNEEEPDKLGEEYIIEISEKTNAETINNMDTDLNEDTRGHDNDADDDVDGNNSDDTNLTKTKAAKPAAKIAKKDFKLARRSSFIKDRRTCPRAGHIKPRENIGRLLQHTTILPFKSNKGYFNCFYCNKQFVVFDELRAHVTTGHHDVTFMAIIKNIVRPHDRIKADISNLSCKICQKRCDNLEEAIKHLEGHDIRFNYDDKLLKPTDCLLTYNLSDGKFSCVVCKAEFHFFKTLTKHMNEHSTNYVCDVCGKCFLLSERLKAHTQVHASNASVNCDMCGKSCATSGRLRSHKRHHHKKRSHVCGICNQSFPTFRERMQHLEDVHNRSPLNLTCKICTKKFKTTSHLGCHMRTEHYNIPYVRKRKKKGDEKSGYQTMNY
ncbi:protein suppressor of hairy wing isoform X2 [Manduca sexta]|nr:protein suppressor of hairy wing isoform X2 [Manduca sexta]